MNLLLAIPLLATLAVPTQRRKVKPIKCVRFATTWEGAITEAKLLRLPMVVHSHKIDGPECKILRGRLLEDRRYMRFAAVSTVEVAVVAGFEEAVEDKNPAVVTYETRVEGKTIKRLARWPNLTITDMRLVNASGAQEYNFAEVHPYTTVVDPFTRGEMKSWKGTFDKKELMDFVKKAMSEIRRQHRQPKITRKELYALDAAEARARHALARKRLAKALSAVARFDRRLASWPGEARKRVAAIRAAAAKIANGELAAVQALAKDNKTAARKRIAVATNVLKGTDFAKKLAELKAKLYQ